MEGEARPQRLAKLLAILGWKARAFRPTQKMNKGNCVGERPPELHATSYNKPPIKWRFEANSSRNNLMGQQQESCGHKVWRLKGRKLFLLLRWREGASRQRFPQKWIRVPYPGI